MALSTTMDKYQYLTIIIKSAATGGNMNIGVEKLVLHRLDFLADGAIILSI
jgi:hypothetical protein